VTDRYLAFVPVIADIRDATEVAAAIVPEAHEVNESLGVIATKVANAIDGLSVELDRRIEAARAGKAPPQLPQSITGSLESPQISERVHRLREWLSHRKPTKEESAEDRAAA
jgi:hypothetical protein